MTLLEQIKDLKSEDIFIASVFFLSSVAPGSLIIYHFKPQLFLDCNVFKLLILAVALTLPFSLVNYFFVQLSPWYRKNVVPADSESAFFLGMTVTMGVVYGSFLATYLSHGSFRDWMSGVFRFEATVMSVVAFSMAEQAIAPPSLSRTGAIVRVTCIIAGAWLAGVILLLPLMMIKHSGEFLGSLVLAIHLGSGRLVVVLSEVACNKGTVLWV
ncbi:MAG: hypothetical protein FJ224_08775, partial [Lentisphaerae bacterium]|nr:hypothetical protein [Lentisphaerota bacterium]